MTEYRPYGVISQAVPCHKYTCRLARICRLPLPSAAASER